MDEIMATASVAMGLVKQTADLIKGLPKSKLNQEEIDKINEVSMNLLEVQQIVLNMRDELSKAHEQIKAYDDWAIEKEKYVAHNVGGCIVYARKQDAEPHEPAHWICANCFSDKQKSPLTRNIMDMYSCARCKANIQTHNTPHYKKTDSS